MSWALEKMGLSGGFRQVGLQELRHLPDQLLGGLKRLLMSTISAASIARPGKNEHTMPTHPSRASVLDMWVL